MRASPFVLAPVIPLQFHASLSLAFSSEDPARISDGSCTDGVDQKEGRGILTTLSPLAQEREM